MTEHMTERFEIDGVNLRAELPEAHATDGARRYPLLLALTHSLDTKEWADRLHAEGILPEMILVTAEGGEESAPAKLLHGITARYRVLESPAARWICGAGHDAVTALRAVLDHPDLFGAAACFSTSFEGTEGAPPLHSPMLRELEGRHSLPEGIRIHFDHGTVGLDECYEPYHRDLGAILRAKGWKDDREFRVTRAQGDSHDPASWRKRLGPALRWLTGR
jgi:hypothetical protein